MSTLKSLVFGLCLLFCLPEAGAHKLIASGRTQIFLGPVWMQIRSGRRPLRTFSYAGNVYVVGRRGQRYSIFIQNRTRQRLEVVVSVDGRDVINGRAARGYARRGYVLNPYRYVDITGFRTSLSSVATFRFSSLSRSYAARLGGSWARIGKIHVAIFRERRPIAYVPRPMIQWDRRPSFNKRSRATGGTRERVARPSLGRKAAPHSRGMLYRRHWRSRRPWRRPGLGTAYGEYRYAPAQNTTFIRATSFPAYRLTIGYNNCAGFRLQGICTFWCPCYRIWYRRYHRDRSSQHNPRFSPPPR